MKLLFSNRGSVLLRKKRSVLPGLPYNGLHILPEWRTVLITDDFWWISDDFLLSTKCHQSSMWLTSCCHVVTWNAETFFSFYLSVSSLELGCKQKNRAGIEEDLCLIVTILPRWTLECPSPMCFSTTAPEPSSPSETRICMVVLCAPPSCVVPILFTVGLPPVHSGSVCEL